MRLLGNPLVWLWRVRHRCGYGVHSPFAFQFITEVIYENAPYYHYADLDAHLRPWERLRRQKGLHLLFRLSNWKQPEVMVVKNCLPLAFRYLSSGCGTARIYDDFPDEKVDFVCIGKPDENVLNHLHSGSMLLLDGMNRYRKWFYNLPTVVTFDLGDIGIAFFDSKYCKQNYIVNF